MTWERLLRPCYWSVDSGSHGKWLRYVLVRGGVSFHQDAVHAELVKVQRTTTPPTAW